MPPVVSFFFCESAGSFSTIRAYIKSSAVIGQKIEKSFLYSVEQFALFFFFFASSSSVTERKKKETKPPPLRPEKKRRGGLKGETAVSSCFVHTRTTIRRAIENRRLYDLYVKCWTIWWPPFIYFFGPCICCTKKEGGGAFIPFELKLKKKNN